jgi:hypothetical protein
VNVRLSKVVFSSDKNSRGQLILASSGGKAILSPSRGYTNSTPSGGGSFNSYSTSQSMVGLSDRIEFDAQGSGMTESAAGQKA